MATVRASRRSLAQMAASRVMDADIDRILAGDKGRFPSFSVFVGSDLVTDKLIREGHAEGKAVVIVDEHENVRVLPAP